MSTKHGRLALGNHWRVVKLADEEQHSNSIIALKSPVIEWVNANCNGSYRLELETLSSHQNDAFGNHVKNSTSTSYRAYVHFDDVRDAVLFKTFWL